MILTYATGGIGYLFVVCGYQGAEADSQTLALTNKLLEEVLGEAKACGTGQSVINYWRFSMTSLWPFLRLPRLLPVGF